MVRIEIANIDFSRAYEKNELFLEFVPYFVEDQKIEIGVSIQDTFFKKNFAFVPEIDISVESGQKYWVCFFVEGATRDPILGLQGGFILTFKDKKNSETILQKEFKNSGKHWIKRKLDDQNTWENPRLYLIGDSHGWTNFGDHTKNITKVSKYTFIRHAHYGVSSASFWSGDFLGFINLLPIEDQDVLVFNFGTYDFRKGIFKHSQKSKIALDETLYSVLFQTFYKLKYLRSVLPKNHLIISSIVPPFRERNIPQDKRLEVFYNSSDSERLRVFNIYRNFWQRHIKLLENMSFLDWTPEYLDPYGFLIDDYMYLEDTHIEKYEKALEFLTKHLDNLDQN